jgi:competence protein ComEC
MLLICICLAWVAGIFLGSYWHITWLWMGCGWLPIGLLFFFKRQRKNLLILALALFALLGGIAYYPAARPPDKIMASINFGTMIELNGSINRMPEIKDQTTHVELSVSSIDDRPAAGQVLVFVPRYPEYSYGDEIRVKGLLSPVPQFDGFDYQAYLAKRGIYATMQSPSIQVLHHQSGFSPLAWIYTFRQNLSESLAAALPEPQAGLAQGTVLGIRSTISPKLQNELSITGTAHFIAISGINLSIIAGMIIALGLRIFGRRHYYYVWLALAIVWFYTVLAGWQAPVIRSAIMASVFLLAELFGRQKLAVPALALSAAIMVGLDPQVLWSVSFQLSFLAMVGLILIAPIFQNLARNFVAKRWGEEGWAAKIMLPITDSFSVSLGSIIFIWPIVAYNFGIVSLVGPLTTFLIAPALTPIIILCSLTALSGLISPPLAQVVGWASWLFLSYMLVMIQSFAALPLIAIQTGAIDLNWVRFYYGFLILGTILKSNFQKIGPWLNGLKNSSAPAQALFARTPKKFIIVPLLIAAFIISTMAANLPDSRLHVSFLDVGEGDAILIQADGQNILVDGGPSPQAISHELSTKLPFWNRNIDMLILTHPHLDHLSGLVEVLHRYQVRSVLAPNLTADNPVYGEWLSVLREKNLELTYADRGQQIILKNQTLIEVLNPVYVASPGEESDFERQGIVLNVCLGNNNFLLTADIDRETEWRLLKARIEPRSTVLKAAHHGSNTSTSIEFLATVQPQFVVISNGADNPFGHPSPDVLGRLQNQITYRTDISGTVEFTTDGKNLWVKTAK